MSLNPTRLENKILVILDELQKETTNANASKEKLAKELAKVIVEEIKEVQINYTGGLIAPNGPVSGTINATIS